MGREEPGWANALLVVIRLSDIAFEASFVLDTLHVHLTRFAVRTSYCRFSPSAPYPAPAELRRALSSHGDSGPVCLTIRFNSYEEGDQC